MAVKMSFGLRVTPWLLPAIFLVGTQASQTSGARATQAPVSPVPSVSVSSSTHEQGPAPTDAGPAKLIVAIVLSGVGAALRVFQRFRRYQGLGIFSSWYTWSFIGFAALLAGAAYTGLAELLAVFLKGGSMAVPQIAGASSIGHGLLAVGRLGRPVKKPARSGDEDSALPDVAAMNQLLDFFYTGVRIHVGNRMYGRARELARQFDFATVRKVTCDLLDSEVEADALSSAEGKKAITRIQALSVSPDSEVDSCYDALRWTILRASYGQLNARLAGEPKRKT